MDLPKCIFVLLIHHENDCIMKTQFKNLFALVIGLIATIGIAVASPDVSVVNVGNKSFALYMNNVNNADVRVTLTDKEGVVLLNDRVKKAAAFARKYNLQNLPEGDYALSVVNGSETVVQPITVSGNNLEISSDKMISVFAPAIQVKSEKLDFTLLCLNESTVTIEITDEYGRVNYNATTHEKGSVERRFNIANLSPGTYTLVTTVHGDNFTQRYNEVFTRGGDIAGH